MWHHELRVPGTAAGPPLRRREGGGGRASRTRGVRLSGLCRGSGHASGGPGARGAPSPGGAASGAAGGRASGGRGRASPGSARRASSASPRAGGSVVAPPVARGLGLGARGFAHGSAGARLRVGGGASRGAGSWRCAGARNVRVGARAAHGALARRGASAWAARGAGCRSFHGGFRCRIHRAQGVSCGSGDARRAGDGRASASGHRQAATRRPTAQGACRFVSEGARRAQPLAASPSGSRSRFRRHAGGRFGGLRCTVSAWRGCGQIVRGAREASSGKAFCRSGGRLGQRLGRGAAHGGRGCSRFRRGRARSGARPTLAGALRAGRCPLPGVAATSQRARGLVRRVARAGGLPPSERLGARGTARPAGSEASLRRSSRSARPMVRALAGCRVRTSGPFPGGVPSEAEVMSGAGRGRSVVSCSTWRGGG